MEQLVREHVDWVQVEFHILPTIVQAGSEDFVLVKSGVYSCSEERYPAQVSSFLGVQPGDEVEMAVDVVTGENLVLYNRSLHKEGRGIYDAWECADVLWLPSKKFLVTITCRTNGPNRDGEPHALFEGLVRLTFNV